jgi:hypothetical protein
MGAKISHLYFGDQVKGLGGNLFRKQLLRFGEWVHPNDPSKTMKITPELVKTLIENFKAKILDKVPVPDTHTNSATANTGYVIGLEETSEGLDAILEVSDQTALEKLNKGLIPGISAAIHNNYMVKDSGKHVGPVLLHAALVDNPYIKGMKDFQPVALADETDVEHTPFILSDDKGEEKLTKEQLIAGLKEIGIDFVELSEKAGKFDKASMDLTEAQKVLADTKAAFGDVIQLGDNVTLADGVKQLVEKVKSEETEVTKLSDRIKGLEVTMKQTEAKNAVADLVKVTKVALADAEKYEKLYLSDKTLFDGITASLKPVVELGEKGLEDPLKPGQKLTDEQLEAEAERIAKENGIKK